MQRKEPLVNKGLAGVDAVPRKNTLTRRANHRHISIIAQFVRSPLAMPDGLSGAIAG
jgi:hypothetical protein